MTERPRSPGRDAWPRLVRHGTARARPGIVHLGPGAFFRAFNAVYTDEAMAAEAGDWAIVAVSLKSPAARDRLKPQGCAYTSVALAPGDERRQIVGSVAEILVAPENPEAVLRVMADPSVRIVSLTVTEKGYCHYPATGRLRRDDPGIVHDLAQPGRPRTAVGFIVEALSRRRAAGHRPFTVLSCDNLPGNGALARGVVLEFAAARDSELADWIAAEARFPSTMVDRITPATTDADIERLGRAAGYLDLGCVFHEPFRQWVIENDFVDGQHPPWDAAGARFVGDVSAFETMKLRCLNGTHSALAYLGYLAGHETIAEAVADPPFEMFCRRLWRDEILPTVPPPEGEDLQGYCAALLERYRNPMIRHRTWQIAMDGSQKLPQRILGTISDCLAAGRTTPGLALVVAGWMRYVGGIDEDGAPIDVRDPLGEALRHASDGAAEPEAKVTALLAIDQVFPPELAADPAFSETVALAYHGLCDRGARDMVQEFAE